ncbi:16S rRNA (cytidine(1402)-2'-O)-methyltransferase [Campylobacter sp. RM9344]|uniref:Ribosomal RNA small subunit methyltransferase I n=1 Tax=Campylobacter californiensis TaxID=1032243 RepID=A0AAW3ZWS1_9BACT|nr:MULTISPECIES: 16S rRNA (cytidine(1402)-2'-O)-methyltransferase [unclassified Campylobacter]MBE2984615.1 16S rRNA (cytidine(1402)-2'-O)-methyltransferase [Campylobacter sp. RM6883]MBE2995097.1 16S rRNA (cytidine(1402)-2'-O)-methyltransferase [Campylobacter sp. RM6913]MBE3029018.1 16S rRNA (cytidine(1402)-2'-O)-methyltransferase [Campylobacter sp. RM9344]MBE3607375.1 16S rRNA (cytidine(1402)-2'-O)-methyltransferase [Campylobacter sp. RM9337]QCD50088.1 16S rRNA (cytidine(1402)-2'-O)-methyltran
MLYFVPTPIGNLEDISLRALSVLRSCEIVVCEDTRVSKSLVRLLNERFDAHINIQNFIPLHTHNESEFFANLTREFFDKNIAYMSDAGMPGISDPGVSLIRYAQNHNIGYEVLSGANAALLSIVASGLCEKEFVFLGFLPNTGKERTQAIQNALNLAYPCVIYESPKRILSLVNDIAKLEPEREIFAIKEATKKFETKFKSSAIKMSEILERSNLNGEWCVVISQSDNPSFETISISDINTLDIAPKAKAKLLSKITGQEVKKIYGELTK